jgi:formyltetrahydrofolate deformylase
MTTSHEYVLSASCPDRAGILSSVSGFLAHSSCDIVDCQLLSEPDSGNFFTRIQFAAPDAVDIGVLSEKFAELAIELRMSWQVDRTGRRPRTMVLVSEELHCLNDLLFRQRAGTLPVDVRAVVSDETSALEAAEWYGIPFYFLPIVDGAEEEQEARVLELAGDLGIELTILAGYLRMPSPRVCGELSGQAINLQAHRAGAKLIGATAHYVTADADGPAIEQDVRRVDHRDDRAGRIAKVRDLECSVLARAVKWHAEHRVLCDGNRTVIFP